MHDMVRNGRHAGVNKSECKSGHVLDGIKYNPDGTVRQRFCTTCARGWQDTRNRRRREKRAAEKAGR